MVGYFSQTLARIAVPLALAFAIAPAWAENEVVPDGLPNPAEKNGKNLFDFTAPNGGAPKDMNERVRIDQKIDARLPLNLEFKDENGKKVVLGQYFGHKPVMISMIQLTCDKVCSAQMDTMTASFNELQFSAGKEFEVLTVSIDPREGPPIAKDVKDERLKIYERASAKDGWHFLTGDEKNIKALAASLGIKYMWDSGSKQFIHPDGIVLATPDGKVARYFMNLDYEPRALRFSVIEASKERVGNVIDQIALSCFHYNPQTGKYSFQVMSFVRVAGLATVFGALLGIALSVMKEKRRGRGRKSTLPGPQLKKA